MACPVRELSKDAYSLTGCYNLEMKRRAFTLIEVVIVSGIIVALTSVVFANFPQFGRTLALRRETNKLALILRKSQAHALAVREFNSTYADDPFCAAPPVRFPPYGISLSMTVGGAGDARDNNTYIIFGDANCTNLYTVTLADGSNEQVEVFDMANGIIIQSLTGYGIPCLAGCSLSDANIVYQRPAPTVILSGNGSTLANLDRIEIILGVANSSLSERIIVRTTGQVSIE